MHRSRPSMVVILTAVAACSTRHDPDANEILSQDSTLAVALNARQRPRRQPLPDACGTVTLAAQPAVATRELAQELAQQAYDAELVGNTQKARSLLVRATKLDGTDKSAAYHLGRTSEVLGDRAGAMAAYCRYLALTPTMAESAEARQRVAELSRPGAPAAMASVSNGISSTRGTRAATTRRATRERPVLESRAAVSIAVDQPARRTAAARRVQSSSVIADRVDGASSVRDAVTIPRDVDSRSSQVADGGDAAAMPDPAPTVEQSAPAARTTSRGPSRVQSAGLGAIAGAIIGAATGRNVKSAVIGAAAGGITGTMVGGATRPIERSIRPWATGTHQRVGNRTAQPPYRMRPAA